jgi:hypothetical protein
MITSVNGNSDKKDIREFVDNFLLAKDSKEFRNHLRDTQPDIELKSRYTNLEGVTEDISVPINVSFFWPDAGI